jgi:ferredoxin
MPPVADRLDSTSFTFNGSVLDGDQMSRGFCLTCISYPTSDCTIETFKEAELF